MLNYQSGFATILFLLKKSENTMNKRIKYIAASISIGLFASTALAESHDYPDITVKSQAMGENGFTYPAITHLESEAIVNDVLFFYSPDMLDYFGNDLEELSRFADESVAINNEAFRRQDIALRRKIVGVLPFPEEAGYDDQALGTERLENLLEILGNPNYHYEAVYDPSYVVALNRYYPELVSPIGLAYLGGKASWVSPRRNLDADRTLAHELGHNDGFAHDQENFAGYSDAIKEYLIHREYANGMGCGSFVSIMKSGDGDRSEFFFSSPIVTNAESESCGSENVSDSARAYKEAVQDDIPNATGTFANNKPTKAATGTVSLSVLSNEVQEGQPVVVQVDWSGASYGDTVQIITRQGTAGIDEFQSSLLSAVYEEGKTNELVIETFDDDIFELDENFTLELIYPSGVSVDRGASMQEITLTSDELGNPGVINFTESRVSLNEGDSRTLTLTRTDGTDGDVTVSVNTVAGTADESDYTELDREITFAHGEDTKTISLFVTDDALEEPLETFTVVISGDALVLGDTTTASASISASDAPSNTGGGSGGSGGGGSMGILSGMALMLLAIRRRFYK
jgi:hypothetical protein